MCIIYYMLHRFKNSELKALSLHHALRSLLMGKITEGIKLSFMLCMSIFIV